MHRYHIGSLAVVVVKERDYPNEMKKRRQDQTIRHYLPFDELEHADKCLEASDGSIIKRIKKHSTFVSSSGSLHFSFLLVEGRCTRQLVLDKDSNKPTYSQSHVRLYVAAYDENEILLTEALHPPLRNIKAFEQLRIIRIVQPKCDLRAYEVAYVYCDYDYSKDKLDYAVCPYEFELIFLHSINEWTREELLELFDEQQIRAQASYVPSCPVSRLVVMRTL